jgi:hypothetical protein
MENGSLRPAQRITERAEFYLRHSIRKKIGEEAACVGWARWGMYSNADSMTDFEAKNNESRTMNGCASKQGGGCRGSYVCGELKQKSSVKVVRNMSIIITTSRLFPFVMHPV